MTYQLSSISPNTVIFNPGPNQVSVYKDDGNPMYQEYLRWLDEGNTPLPAPEPKPAPVLTTEQKLNAAGLTVAELRELFGLAEGNEPLPADEPPTE